MILTNNYDHPLSIAVWLATDDYDHGRWPGRVFLSATGLLKPVRQIILGNRVIQEVKDQEAELESFVASRMGTAIHDSVERSWNGNYKATLRKLGHPESVVNRVLVNPTPEELAQCKNPIPVYMEQRHHKEIDGYIIDGKFDFVGNGFLEDFKSTGTYSFTKNDKDEDYIKQGSIYRWLAPHIITRDYMFIRFIFTDWQKIYAKTRKGYPQSRVASRRLDLMSLEETEQFVRDKVAEVKRLTTAPESALPECEAKDLWQTPTVYKYFSKPTNKRSSGNFDTYAEAHAKMMKTGKGVIKEFPGQIRRCGYCPAFELCTQKDRFAAQGLLAV